MKVYIGVSKEKNFEDVHTMIHQLDDSGRSDFDRIFDSGPIEPGGFEIYDRDHYSNDDFNRDLITELLPFDPPANLNLWDLDLTLLQLVFFVLCAKDWRPLYLDELQIVDKIPRPVFDFDEPL